MILSKSVIFELISNNFPYLREFGVLKIGLFGSYLKGTSNPKSDIDFLVELDPEKTTYDNYFELIEFLEKLFKKKVEVITVDFLSPHIGPHILEEVEYIESAA